MSRFSVEKNMIGAAPITTQSQQPIVMPTVFDKFTVAIDRDGVLCECNDAITGPDKYIQIQDLIVLKLQINSQLELCNRNQKSRNNHL